MSPHTDQTLVTEVAGWSVAAASPDTVTTPAGLDDLIWLPAHVPGTVAGALRDASEWSYGEARDLDAEDWWFRTRLNGIAAADDEEVVLALGGIATLAEVFLDGDLILRSESMFAQHEVALSDGVSDGAVLSIRCRALGPLISGSRSPRARWRSRVAAGGLRHYRTMLLGRAPGFAPEPAAVGPWRGVTLLRRRDLVVDDLRLRARIIRRDGCLAVRARLRGVGDASLTSIALEVSGPTDTHAGALALAPSPSGVVATGEVVVPDVALWWPHTHGDPSLYSVRLRVTTTNGVVLVDGGRVGFRELAPGPPEHNVLVHGLDLRVNGVRVFARGAVWSPIDLVGMAPTEDNLRAALEHVRDAGMNMLRIPGTGAYESSTFHDLCDELGILVWQDFMFANFDYPVHDRDFRAAVEAEARRVLADLGWRPSLSVLCGNSEVEQQGAMQGFAPDEVRGELFGELLARFISEAEVDATYVPSAPCGGDMPFRPGVGIANYYGVGGYRRPRSDARAAGVRFAAECLAFANLSADDGFSDVGAPCDVGATWDFADVRDHYVAELYGVDVPALRRDDPQRLLALGQAASGELMADVFGEWRRAASPCCGALMLWLTDVAPGAGWGVLDHRGAPKVAYHHLRRALAPRAVWLTDEGLGGLDVHVANDRGERLRARLRVAFYRDSEVLVDEASTSVAVAPHSVERHRVEELLGRFIDASYAYRFGPPGFDVVVASLERDEIGRELISQAAWFPSGRPAIAHTAERLGLGATSEWEGDDLIVTVDTRRFAHGVRLHVPGFAAADDAFPIEPGRSRTLRLRRQASTDDDGKDVVGHVSAINLTGPIAIEMLPA